MGAKDAEMPDHEHTPSAAAKLVNPFDTPSTMFCTSVRVSPCSALCFCSSLGRATVKIPSASASCISGWSCAAQLALGALHRDLAALELERDALGHRHRLLADTRHRASYQTTASSSPPRLAVRASRSVISPFGVETIAMPRPFLTRGSSRHFT